MSKLKKFEKIYFDYHLKLVRKELKYKRCCNCNKNLENADLISDCYTCHKNYCFNCCNDLFFSNYFKMPKKNVNDLILVLFHSLDRHYFNDMCCKKNYYLNFIPNKFHLLTYYNKYNTIYKTLKNNNIEIEINRNNKIDKIYYNNLRLLYDYTNSIFWKTYILVKKNIPIDIIYILLKFNINYIKFKLY